MGGKIEAISIKNGIEKTMKKTKNIKKLEKVPATPCGTRDPRPRGGGRGRSKPLPRGLKGLKTDTPR